MKIYCLMFEANCNYESKPELIGAFLDKTKADALALKKNVGDDWGQDHCWVEELEEGVEKPPEPEIQVEFKPQPKVPKVKLMLAGMTKEQVREYMRTP